MKAETPAAIPASMVSARAGLTAMSLRIVPPAGTDAYSERVNDMPAANSSGTATMSPTDHLPGLLLGMILGRFSVMLSSSPGRR